MARRKQGKAARISWNRANLLAEAAEVPAAQARNYISSFRGTEEAETIYNYLDKPNPTFRDALGKRLIKGAQGATIPARGPRGPRRTTRNRRPSNGDPTRPVRAGGPNQFGTDKTGTPLECIEAIKALEEQYGAQEIRETIALIDAVRN